MSEHNLSEPYQSAYKPNHSVDMAFVCVQNDILLVMDNQNVVIMVLLDLSAAFDTVDYKVMMHKFSPDLGVVQNALDWFKSYLSDRVQPVHICGATSPARHLAYGIPRGSVLGPQLFSVYANASKAFDLVCHSLLTTCCATHCSFTSLNRMGILGNAFNGCSPTFSTENNV